MLVYGSTMMYEMVITLSLQAKLHPNLAYFRAKKVHRSSDVDFCTNLGNTY